jgi:MoxR-like ATPase
MKYAKNKEKVKTMNIQKLPVEKVYEDEIKRLIENETDHCPNGWQMSPKSVRKFILGDEELNISKKIYGNDKLVERSIVTLATKRGLLLIGVPGTAKTLLSELLSAAICNQSLNTIQGNAGTSEVDLKYGWHYALLIAEGPNKQSLIESPLLKAMKEGSLVRIEEITRIPQEVQDMLISIMSDKVMMIPEFSENNYCFAKEGFNIIATANTLDKGVNDMSSALKRRFNIEMVKPVNNIKLEKEIVKKQIGTLQENIGLDEEVIHLLTTVFVEMRNGESTEGKALEKPSKNLSTAELVNVYQECATYAQFFNNNQMDMKSVSEKLITSFDMADEADVSALTYYFEKVIKERGKVNDLYNKLYQSRIGLL